MRFNIIIYVLLLFQIKHFLIDFCWQPPYEWQNKGTYLHPGGIIHSGKHAIGTFIVLLAMAPTMFDKILFLAAFDFVTHYHIDWTKMNLSRSLTPADSRFWVFLGLDQALHQAVMLAIVAMLVG